MTDYTSFRPSKLWRRLPVERRTEAATLFWSDEQSIDQQMEAVGAIASHMKFRPRSVADLPIEKKARYLATLPTVSDTIAARALINYHLERQRPMMGAFLDSLGITHENGLISDEAVSKPDEGKLVRSPANTIRPAGRASHARQSGSKPGSKYAYQPPTHGSSSQTIVFDASSVDGRPSHVKRRTIPASPSAARTWRVSRDALPPARNVRMPGVRACCSLPSHSAPIGRSVPNASGRPRLFQKRRSNCSS